MRLRNAALACLLLAPGLAVRAEAAAMSTGWEDFPGSQEECLQAGAARLRQMGYRVTVNPQTVFGWRGPDGVAVRCIAERELAAIFVHAAGESEEARLTLEELRAAYRDWRARRQGGGAKFAP